ncbi:DUF2799 domain-containing protein [Dickeya oryzae]|uniref:DUF2799 domain-containing protein n=2 Tax=Dickeya oryzae TaxID=1240404 RepID=A0AB39IWK8_9GAMM|nr:DUF2799 domain-containing protein [Dickeya oryzae]MCA6992763.1 DUF2799 domain-containing protein [Dickeya oryzae]
MNSRSLSEIIKGKTGNCVILGVFIYPAANSAGSIMRNGMVLVGLLLLVGCQPPPSTSPTKNGHSVWYEAGYNDASSGLIVKDDETLSEWFGNPDVDRHAYLDGYQAGQRAWCNSSNIEAWGRAGKPFPPSCDGANDAETLKKVWQRAADSLPLAVGSAH